ncbi:MAG: hypothetical protein RLZZ15_4151 [Verrucomicrobiota bacterium]|jgi:hypothetical protein
MKNHTITLAVTLGTIAVAATLLSVRRHVNAESLIGFVSVSALMGVAILDYRINWRRLFGR